MDFFLFVSDSRLVNSQALISLKHENCFGQKFMRRDQFKAKPIYDSCPSPNYHSTWNFTESNIQHYMDMCHVCIMILHELLPKFYNVRSRVDHVECYNSLFGRDFRWSSRLQGLSVNKSSDFEWHSDNNSCFPMISMRRSCNAGEVNKRFDTIESWTWVASGRLAYHDWQNKNYGSSTFVWHRNHLTWDCP